MSAALGAGRILRSMLFVPANRKKYIDKAHERGSDAIILDLEDSIALADKASARKCLSDAVAHLVGHGVDQIFVRINRPLQLAIRDIEEAISPDVAGIIVPKTHSADHIRLLCELISDVEADRGMTAGHTVLGVRVETAQAFFQMETIVAADPRIVFFGLGGEDFSLSIGVEPDVDTLIYPKQRAIIAAAAAGVTPIGLVSSGADFSNLDRMREIVEQSRRFGFRGATCIHPAVVPILNAGFRPTAEQVASARRLAEAFEAGLRESSASINVDGKMVDYPIAYRAHRLIQQHEAIEARELRSSRLAGT